MTEEAHLRTSLHTDHEVETLGRRLGARGPEAWLGISTAGAPRGMRRYATDLRLGGPSGGALSVIHKSAYVDLGPVVIDDRATLTVEISWRPASLAPLFPVFSGWLTVRPGEITIDGRYVPPGGPLGFVADRTLLNRAARLTADWVLRELDGARPRSAMSHESDAEPFKPDPAALT